MKSGGKNWQYVILSPDISSTVISPKDICMYGAWYGVLLWYAMAWRGKTWHGMAWYGMVWYGMVIAWQDMVWYGMVLYGMVW